MTVEIHDKLIALVADVDELKGKEAQLKSKKTRHLEQIAESEGEVSRCNDELTDIRENQLRLKREMDGLRDELFAREEEEAIIVDDVHVVTDGENSQTDSETKRAWDARAKHLKAGSIREGRDRLGRIKPRDGQLSIALCSAPIVLHDDPTLCGSRNLEDPTGRAWPSYLPPRHSGISESAGVASCR